jgi:hypothetical protein
MAPASISMLSSLASTLHLVLSLEVLFAAFRIRWINYSTVCDTYSSKISTNNPYSQSAWLQYVSRSRVLRVDRCVSGK